ncbi:MAG: cytochrome c3 family protein [Sulfurimonas sp.]|uniref:cytochrome c3 family protein n=1 Tax=Sulfurimonas sp. TaxID=2022749 RepID=UPI0025D7F290|nr:cytochrome c3 family protein [Sulfurimonas sp.]MCK9454889.1 cytochrome c3 family protein [Sulfurimonas sp.]
MEKKYIKLSLIAGIVVLVVILFITLGVAEKLGRLGNVSVNIAKSMANASHGDPRSMEQMSVEYIEANTGSTKEVNREELPKALRVVKKYGHSPFSMGSCAVCHAPKRSKPAAIITNTVSELCYKCHEPKARVDERLRELDCNKCHNPHHADRKKLIRDTVTQESCPVGDFD